ANADGIADVFRRVWQTHVWEPFVAQGEPAERWPEIRATLERVQPLALDAVIGIFGVAMETTIEKAIAREVDLAEGAQTENRNREWCVLPPRSSPYRLGRGGGVPGGGREDPGTRVRDRDCRARQRVMPSV